MSKKRKKKKKQVKDNPFFYRKNDGVKTELAKRAGNE
jgi:hypothetical protein